VGISENCPKVPAERLKALIADLASPEQKVRLDAEVALAQMREAAAEALHQAEDEGEIELRLRVRLLLEKLQPRSAVSVREHRAILALEVRGTKEAAAVLRKLADGLTDAESTRQAKSALTRLIGRR
jgi:hypothetical protein